MILDEDASFSALLEDVFKQAKLEVTIQKDVQKALQQIKDFTPNILVAEYQLSRVDGLSLLNILKTANLTVPVIFISSSLDKEKVRNLIRNGAGGIFIKPLNVFALMKRLRQLLEQQAALAQHADKSAVETVVNALGFRFKAFPCRSPRSLAFAQKLHDHKDFKMTLMLSGKEGLPFDALCEDFKGFLDLGSEAVKQITVQQINESFIDESMRLAKEKHYKRSTFIIRNLTKLSDEQNKIVYSVIKKEGLYKNLESDVRFLFCLDKQLDNLFDEGLISENLYIMMGSTELMIPSLKECPEDIPFIAQKILEDIATKHAWKDVPRLDKGGKMFLRETFWERNSDSLRQALEQTLSRGQKMLLTRRDFGESWDEKDFYGPYLPVKRLVSFLEQKRNDLVMAASFLCEKDTSKTAHILSCSASLVEKIEKDKS